MIELCRQYYPWCAKTIPSDVIQDLDNRGVSNVVPFSQLSVLYIEENTETQLILRRVLKTRINRDIEFETAKTAEIGIRKIKTTDYGLVFLGFSVPDTRGLLFLEEIREMGKTVPVIFLTGMGKETEKGSVIRANANDNLKSEIQKNEFMDKVRKRLQRETVIKSPRLELSGLEKELILELESNGVLEIMLETEEGSLHYKGMKRFSDTRGLEITSLILETLAEKGVIEETNNQWVVLCPICESAVTDDSSNYICPRCKSIKFVRVKFLSHSFCGFTGDRREFVTEAGLVCPNCKVELTTELDSSISMESDGYFVLGSSFECESCDTKFNKPEIVHGCDRCGGDFDYKNMDYMHLRDYKVI